MVHDLPCPIDDWRFSSRGLLGATHQSAGPLEGQCIGDVPFLVCINVYPNVNGLTSTYDFSWYMAVNQHLRSLPCSQPARPHHQKMVSLWIGETPSNWWYYHREWTTNTWMCNWGQQSPGQPSSLGNHMAVGELKPFITCRTEQTANWRCILCFTIDDLPAVDRISFMFNIQTS